MKLINYFYLSHENTVFYLFRSYFPNYIGDESVRSLAKKSADSLFVGPRILEWFLFEERDARSIDTEITLNNTIFYLMSSDRDSNYFVPPPTVPPKNLLGIGFYAITMSENIRVTVKL